MKPYQLLLVFLIFFSLQFSTAQSKSLNKNATISVLTVGPGKNLSDKFGHSAFRIKNGNEDLVFGYGAYPFNDPNFILNFARGKLNYSMDLTEYKRFYYAYAEYYKRSIYEQELNLTQNQKNTLYTYLLNNYNPENREYLYDFFFDNCATKIRDVVSTTFNGKVVYNKPDNFTEKTYRTLIQDELNYNTWGSFGIDLALGSIIDQKAPAYDYMFLPKNIHAFFDAATVNDKPLIKSKKTIYEPKEIIGINWLSTITGPFVIIGFLSIALIVITYKDFKKNSLTKSVDIVIFGLTGLIGVFMLLLWFATDHEMTAYNYNLLWAMPLNLIAINGLLQKKPSVKFTKYMVFLLLMLSLMTMHWIIGVQRFAPALFPLLIALFLRYAYIITYSKKTQVIK